MQNITITPARIKKELTALLACFLIGFAANVGAIVYYKTKFTETVTSLPYVLLFALVLYMLWVLLRIVPILFVRLFRH
jgi:hypothetical protein